MLTAGPKVLSALATLKTQPDFQVFLEWLKQEERETLNTLLDVKENALIFRAQGAGQFLRDLLEKIEGSGETLRKYGPGRSG